MQLFGEDAYYESMLKYAKHLSAEGRSLRFHSSALNRKEVDALEQWSLPLWPSSE